MSLRGLSFLAVLLASPACAGKPTALPQASTAATSASPNKSIERECALLPATETLPEPLRSLRGPCVGGDTVACRHIGWTLVAGEGATPVNDDPTARPFLACACARHEAIACTGLGLLYEYGLGARQDLTRARDLYTLACGSGVASACTNLGAFYANGNGVERNVGRAFALYEQACERGDVVGCAGLGEFYKTGEGVAKDLARATKLAERACDGGSAVGCNNLGVDYLGGGVRVRNDATAAALFRKACEGRNALGCYNLGRKYVTARPSDPSTAATFFRRGCEMHSRIGETDCCASLAVLAVGGVVTDVPSQQVRLWLADGCKEGVPVACDALAQIRP